jgi:hypothetical protein
MRRRGPRTRAVQLGGDVAQVVLVEENLRHSAGAAARAGRRQASRGEQRAGEARSEQRRGNVAARALGKRARKRLARRRRQAEAGCALRAAALPGPWAELPRGRRRGAHAPGCHPAAAPTAPSSRASAPQSPRPEAPAPAPARRASREHAASGGARSLVRTQRRASGAHGAAARGGAAAWRRGRRGGAHGRTIASVSELGRCGRCATRRRAYRRGAQPRRGARREERPSECRRGPLARAASNGWILKLRRAPDSLTGCRSALARAAPTTALRR